MIFRKFLTTSKRSPLKIKCDRGKECYSPISKNFLKIKKTTIKFKIHR